MKSLIQQYVHHADGRISLEGFPDVTLELIQEQGRVTHRDIRGELGMPTYEEEWEAMDDSDVQSRRMIRFVLMDESPTRFPGNYRMQPRNVSLPPVCYLEFGHEGYNVGLVYGYILAFKENLETLKNMGIDVPGFVEGQCIIAQAVLFESRLAGKAWEAVQRNIFTHACALVEKVPGTQDGTGTLKEVSLVSSDYPGCQNARILKWWEEPLPSTLRQED